MYLAWKRQRGSGAPWRYCGVTSPSCEEDHKSFADASSDTAIRTRLSFFNALDRRYPEASVPLGLSDTLEFEQRCWWLGISMGQGATLRAVNRRTNLLWP